MVDDADLQGLDPYDLMQVEADRLDRFFAGLDEPAWSRLTLAGLVRTRRLGPSPSSEQYNTASLDGTVGDFLASLGARGATDLPSANELGIRELDDHPTAQLIDEWRAVNDGQARGVPPSGPW